jgi:hypothetical protein
VIYIIAYVVLLVIVLLFNAGASIVSEDKEK